MNTFELKVTAPPVVGALTSHDLEYVVNRIGHHRFLSSSSSSLTVLRSKLFEACKTMAYISQILYNFYELESLNISMDEETKTSVGSVTVLSFITRHNLSKFEKDSKVEISFHTENDEVEYYRVKVWRGTKLSAEHTYQVTDHIYSYDMNFPPPSEFVDMLAKELATDDIR